MSRTIIHTLAFNTPSMVEGALKCHYPGKYERWLVYCGFPGFPESDYRRLAEIYECQYAIIGNAGVSENWNAVARIVDLHDDDFLIGLDPDERPEQMGWIEAIVDVMLERDMIGYVTLNKINYEAEKNFNDFDRINVAGYVCRKYRSEIAWILGGFSGKCLREIGGLKQEQPFYGYLEQATLKAMRKHGYDWLMLDNYYARHIMSDEVLTEWKNENRERRTNISFEEWNTARINKVHYAR